MKLSARRPRALVRTRPCAASPFPQRLRKNHLMFRPQNPAATDELQIGGCPHYMPSLRIEHVALMVAVSILSHEAKPVIETSE